MTFRPEPIAPVTWPAIHALLAPAIRRADFTTTELIDELLDKTAQLWVMRKGGDPIAAAVSELVRTPAGLHVHGRLLAGRKMSAWIDELIRVIRDHAETVGAHKITVDGRLGWRPVLEHRGWHLEAVTMALPLAAKEPVHG